MGKKGKKKKRIINRQLVLGLFIIVLMVGGGFGIMFGGFSSGGGGRGSATYEGHSFKYVNNMFITELNGEQVQFPYLPQEVEHINISPKVARTLNESMAMLATSHFEAGQKEEIATAQYFMKRTVEEHLDKRVVMGFLEPNHTIRLTCDNATSYSPVLVYEMANQTGVKAEEDDCIRVKGEGANSFTMLTTRILYELFGVL